MTGCGNTDTTDMTYPVYNSALNEYDSTDGTFSYFASDLCVAEDVNVGTDTTDSQVAEAAGVFNLNTKEITYSQNIFEQLYPASTTKILTAYIIIKYCDLNDMVTVSENAVTQSEDSSICNLNAGDVISVRDLLYGLLLASGNDAAVALAEYYAGTADNFAEVMNNEAAALGASASHFVNPNGLPDEDHYTTVYDMYLIFKEAIRYTDFVNIIHTQSYTATYSNASGSEVTNVWNNNNRYISGKKEAPTGITVIGGKSGTTGAAGYCLVLYSQNEAGEDIVSIVFKADGISNLYLLMNQILAGYAN
jgi:D-alanyl-D-alanine carboxypeptidase (penicillin-binding protein 5/6)